MKDLKIIMSTEEHSARYVLNYFVLQSIKDFVIIGNEYWFCDIC